MSEYLIVLAIALLPDLGSGIGALVAESTVATRLISAMSFAAGFAFFALPASYLR